MRGRAFAWLVAALVLAGCGDGNVAEPEGLGIAAARYLDYALVLMQTYSINRYEIDWTTFSDSTYAEAGEAKTEADTYDAIRSALERLGDNHSFFQPPPDASLNAAASTPARTDPSAELLDGSTGYVDVPAFFGGGPDGDAHATLYHGLIESVEGAGACRWVVDLRGNSGGNMWPMLAGLGPILGDGQEGALGFFVDPDSVVNTWFYDLGSAGVDGTAFVSVDEPYVATVADPPVAVLTDAITASSGEAVAVAFRGRPQSRSFGQPTYGIPTANLSFQLSDGAVIFITFAWTADRDGVIYDAPVRPDEAIAGERTGDPSTDAALAAALAWVEGFPCS
jgi:carboxyl-terminal processing protease